MGTNCPAFSQLSIRARFGRVLRQCPLHFLNEKVFAGIFVFFFVVQKEQEDALPFLVNGVIDAPRRRRTEPVAGVLAPRFENRQRQVFQTGHMVAHLLRCFGEPSFQPSEIVGQILVTFLHIVGHQRRECGRFDNGEGACHWFSAYASAVR
jgi:hypothetical protein